MPIDDRYRNLPFTEASDYLRGKINLDTDKWDDILDAEHDAAFVVAGAKGSLLSDLRGAVDRAIASGQRPEEFLKEFERISEGWDHLGDKAWRANIIHQTNLTQSYAAGRATYQLDPEVMRVQPYLRWVHSNSGRPRPAHLALDGRVFRADQIPFYPPNGYGCLCRTISLTQAQVERQGLKVDSLQAGDTLPYRDERGNLREAVIKPDKGFDRIPGRGDRRQLLEGMIARMPASVAAPLRAELDRIDDEFVERRRRLSAPSDVAKIPPDTRDTFRQLRETEEKMRTLDPLDPEFAVLSDLKTKLLKSLDDSAKDLGVSFPDLMTALQPRSVRAIPDHRELLGAGEEAIGKPKLRSLDKALQPSAKLKKLEAEYARLDREVDRLMDEDMGAAFKSDTYQQWDATNKLIEAEKARQRAKAVDSMAAIRAELVQMSREDAEALAARVKINKAATKIFTEAELREDLADFYQLTGGKGSTLKKISRKEDRAWADDSDGEINIGSFRSRDGMRRMLFHETGHLVEAEDRAGIGRRTENWVRSRATGTEQKLSVLTGDGGYEDVEKALPDAFVHPYVGKLYGDSTGEAISVGLEHFRSPEKMLELYERDREHFMLIIGAIRR